MEEKETVKKCISSYVEEEKMKNRLYKLIFSLLIAVMCANCALPALAAAEMSEGEKKYFEDSVAASKKTFLQLYEVLWREHKLDATFPELNSVETVKNTNINEKNAKQYEEFLRDLEKRFCEENNREIATLYENLSVEAIAKSEEPQVKDYIRESTKKILEGNAKDLCEQVVRSLRKKHRGLYIMTGTTEIDLTSPELARQTVSIALQNLIQDLTQNKIMEDQKIEELKENLKMEDLMGEDISKLPEAWQSLSALLLIHGLRISYFMASVTAGTHKIDPNLLRESFNLVTLYSIYYWDAMESDVRAIFEEAYAVFQLQLEGATK